MIDSFDNMRILFNTIKTISPLDNTYCVIFVYNSPDTMSDSLHESECIFEEELHMIISSFKKVARNVYAIDGEQAFFTNILSLKQQYKYVLVYSMAQNLRGNGRRSLIPLLCDYYHLINIGADFMSCTFGRSKDIMYRLLKSEGLPFPETYFIYNRDEIVRILPKIKTGKWLLKPNNESSSIGMEVYDFNRYSIRCLESYS